MGRRGLDDVPETPEYSQDPTPPAKLSKVKEEDTNAIPRVEFGMGSAEGLLTLIILQCIVL